MNYKITRINDEENKSSILTLEMVKNFEENVKLENFRVALNSEYDPESEIEIEGIDDNNICYVYVEADWEYHIDYDIPFDALYGNLFFDEFTKITYIEVLDFYCKKMIFENEETENEMKRFILEKLNSDSKFLKEISLNNQEEMSERDAVSYISY